MNLDELRSVRRTERQKDSLQHLRDSFYADAAAYIADLKEERDAAAAAAEDPFSAPAVRQLTDEIKSAEEVVEAIYERRVGKVVKQASFAAADMPTDEDGLTREERELFADLVDRIRANRTTVLELLSGETSAPDGTGATTDSADTADASAEGTAPGGTDPTRETTGATREATDGSPESAAPADPPPPPEEGRGEAPPPDDVLSEAMGNTREEDARRERHESGRSDGSQAPDRSTDGGTTTERSSERSTTEHSPAGGPAEPTADEERTTVRITADVGEILGVDGREYDLVREDVVTLPSTNAGPLVERDAAERLD